jgi:hypothetical protein
VPVSRLASESDIQGTRIPTRITDTDIHITDTFIRIGTVPVSTGTTVIAHSSRGRFTERVSGIGVKPKTGTFFEAGGVQKSRRLYFFGEPEAAGTVVDVTDGDGS